MHMGSVFSFLEVEMMKQLKSGTEGKHDHEKSSDSLPLSMTGQKKERMRVKDDGRAQRKELARGLSAIVSTF